MVHISCAVHTVNLALKAMEAQMKTSNILSMELVSICLDEAKGCATKAKITQRH